MSIRSERFKGVTILFIPDRSHWKTNTKFSGRMKTQRQLVIEHGGHVDDILSDNTTHIVVSDKCENGTDAYEWLQTDAIPARIPIVKELWIQDSVCSSDGIRPIDPYLVPFSGIQSTEGQSDADTDTMGEDESMSTKPTDNFNDTSDSSSQGSSVRNRSIISTRRETGDSGQWRSRRGSRKNITPPHLLEFPMYSEPEPMEDVNEEDIKEEETDNDIKFDEYLSSDESDNYSSRPFALKGDIVKELQLMADACTAAGGNEKDFKASKYRFALKYIENHGPDIIYSGKQFKNVRGFGLSMIENIDNIIAHGSLTFKREGKLPDPAIVLFKQIMGVGHSTAEEWLNVYDLHSISDLEKAVAEGRVKLNSTQTKGLQYFEDLREKMPRHEVEEIGAVIKLYAKAIDPDFEVILMGSYRRGASESGDVDVLVTHPNGQSHDLVFILLVDRLERGGVIVDKFSSISGQEGSLHCVCKLPGMRFRQLDIFVCRYELKGSYLVEYTGDTILLRKMKYYAFQKQMRLSSKGVFKNVARDKRRKLSDGVCIASKTERDVFAALGLKYLKPIERDGSIDIYKLIIKKEENQEKTEKRKE